VIRQSKIEGGTSVDEYRTANKTLWNEWAPLHYGSELYDVEGFKAGKLGLFPLEREEVGDVAGKSLLHLQCHFGKDTLSWARLGARVTGADFSEEAIMLARRLSAEIGVPATFVCSDLYALPEALDGHEQFDIVFTSYGALSWLPAMAGWARVIDHFLKPGGLFYIAEFHPFTYVFDNRSDEGTTELRVTYPYFDIGEPLRFETEGSYAVSTDHTGIEYYWPHSMGDIVNSLLAVGLRLEFLHEHPFSVDGSMFAGMVKGEDGYYRLTGQNVELPLMFSIKAWKPVE
jgi:SAM-dependent methyltransferase